MKTVIFEPFSYSFCIFFIFSGPDRNSTSILRFSDSFYRAAKWAFSILKLPPPRREPQTQAPLDTTLWKISIPRCRDLKRNGSKLLQHICWCAQNTAIAGKTTLRARILKQQSHLKVSSRLKTAISLEKYNLDLRNSPPPPKKGLGGTKKAETLCFQTDEGHGKATKNNAGVVREFAGCFSLSPLQVSPSVRARILKWWSRLKCSTRFKTSISLEKFNLDLRNSPWKWGFGGRPAWILHSHLKCFNPGGRSWISESLGPQGKKGPVTRKGAATLLHFLSSATPSPATRQAPLYQV